MKRELQERAWRLIADIQNCSEIDKSIIIETWDIWKGKGLNNFMKKYIIRTIEQKISLKNLGIIQNKL